MEEYARNKKMDDLFIFFLVPTLCSMNSVAPCILQRVLPYFFKQSMEEHSLITELKNLNHELATISMIDEFAKYARMERRIQRIKSHLKEKANSRMAETLKYRMIFSYAFQCLKVITAVLIIWYYRYIPVLQIPEPWLYPFGNLLSLPTGVPGAISVSSWILISSSFCSNFMNLIT